jgi:aspartate-semialdehyde dehydrogenase
MKLSKARIVVTGVSSVTGRDVLNILAEKGVPAENVVALEGGRMGDKDVSFGENSILPVQSTETYAFTAGQIVIHVGEARDAASLAKKVAAVGGLLIDGTGTFSFDPDVPLIVPEVNGTLLAGALKKNVVASPNSIAILASLALNPIHLKAKLTRAVISTYQAVSHWGREAQDELFNQTKAMFMTATMAPEALPKQIAFNCYPMLGLERDDGLTETEWQAMAQLKKILDPKIKFAINTVTIPAFVGDGMMINVECADEISPIKASMWMTGQKGLGVIENGEDLPTHADISSEDFTYVARMRDDISVENGLAFWLIGDNLRKGSAMNLVQIAEEYAATK